jgi:hypothetical protein
MSRLYKIIESFNDFGGKIIAIYYEIHGKRIITLYEQNSRFINVKSGGAYGYPHATDC